MMSLRFAAAPLFVLAGTAMAVEPIALGSVPDLGLRTRIAELEPAAQVRALRTLARPALLAQSHNLTVESSGVMRFTTCLPKIAPGAAPAPVAAPVIAPAPVPIANVPAYSSRPGSARSIYLDFNGMVVTGKQWNTSYSIASWDAIPFTLDGDLTQFSDAEQAAIHDIWLAVALDFAPYDVNVTTVMPTGGQMSHCLITRSTDSAGQTCPMGATAGGVAYLDTFGSSNYFPAWVYYDNLSSNSSYIAEAAAHEVGHNLSLSHDGTSGGGALEYYPGHGANPWDWGPIMGTGYNRTVSQWSMNSYAAANNSEDDLTLIGNRLGYIADDHGGFISTATPLPLTGAAGSNRTITATTGLISTASDSDLFKFESRNGAFTITAEPIDAEGTVITAGRMGQNLDLQLDILDSSGTVVTGLSSSTDNQAAETLSGSIPSPGTYYLRVRGAGNLDPLSTGYPAYGSIGGYTISGTVPPELAGSVSLASASVTVAEGDVTNTILITVQRSSWATSPISVDYATSDISTTAGSDYTATSGTLNWALGDSSPKTVSIQILGDITEEPNEGLLFTISNPTGGASLSGYTTTLVVLQNDDGPSAAIIASSQSKISPNGTGDSGPCGAGAIAGLLLGLGALLVARRRR